MKSRFRRLMDTLERVAIAMNVRRLNRIIAGIGGVLLGVFGIAVMLMSRDHWPAGGICILFAVISIIASRRGLDE